MKKPQASNLAALASYADRKNRHNYKIKLMNSLNINEPINKAAPNLSACPDCGNLVSNRAESCPRCGRFFQSFRLTEVIGRNWSLRIAWGVVLGYLLIF